MIRTAGKILLCALATVVGTMLGGLAASALPLAQPKLPSQVDAGRLILYTFAGAVVLSVTLTELSRCLRGNRRTRFAVIAWLAYAWLGVNNTIEASIFTTIGGGPFVIVTMLFPCLFAAAAVALLFGGSGTRPPVQFFAGQTVVQWAIRLAAAIIVFPVIYFFFGTPVGLIVGKFYQDQAFGLQMPSSLGVLLAVQFVRSLIALLAALPVLIVWSGSRRGFAWTFGLSLFVLSGLYGLIQAYWMPWTLRSIHTIELLFDSLAYAWLVAMLLLPRARTLVAEVGAPNYTI